MRTILILALLLTLTGCAAAPLTDAIEVGMRCINGQVQVVIGAIGPGNFAFMVPHRACGESI